MMSGRVVRRLALGGLAVCSLFLFCGLARGTETVRTGEQAQPHQVPEPEPVATRPVGAPAPAQVVGLDPETSDTALLRWLPERGARYRLCIATGYPPVSPVACYDAGRGPAWSVGVPQADGEAFYLTLQACRESECAPPVPAGAVGRRAADGRDFYGVALPLPEGRARLGAFVRSGPATVRYYRAAAGAADLAASDCRDVAAGQACGAVEVTVPGALVGVAAEREGAGERGVTLQVRDTPTIYFMLDDGTGIVAGGKYLMQSILDEHGVKGTFFLTGKAMQTYPSAVRALVAGGHRVGNHTWSHPFLTRLSDEAIGRELDRAEAQFGALVPGGTLRPCFRAPNGDLNERVLRVVDGRGYRQYAQTVSSNDWAGIAAEQIAQNVLAGARDGAVVSFHTQMPHTATALRRLVPSLLAQGYRFGLVC